MDKRGLLAELMFGKWSPLNYVFRPRGKGRLYVLAYHRICDPVENYPFNRTIMSATPEQFERQLSFIKNHFNVVNFHDLQGILQQDGGIKENTLIITFDDGYKDNATVAVPMLTSHGLTAAFYVTTGNVEKGELLWFDLLHFHVRNMPKGSYRMGSAGERFVRTGDDRVDFHNIGQYLRSVPDVERVLIMSQLRDWSLVPNAEVHRELADVLTWQDVKAMSDAGFEIGSHSCTHPHLYRLDRAGQMQELLDSKSIIEQHIGKPVVSFSYPTGGFDADTVECVAEAGYRFAVAYNEGVWKQDKNRYLIPRVHVEPDIGFARFKGSLIFPKLFLHGLNALDE